MTTKKEPQERAEWALIKSTLGRYFNNPARQAEAAASLERGVSDATVLANLKATMHNPSVSYRDAAVIQMAFALCNPGLDTTVRPPGARAIGEKFGTYVAESHVKAVADAYQNIGKNSSALVRGNDPAFDSLLTWMRTALHPQIDACFQYACAEIAGMARPVDPMPKLNVARLTYSTVRKLYSELLQIPSQGAFQQYIVASLLDALIQQTGVSDYRVQTKRLNASDRSSGAAGDIEIAAGNRVIEAYEVTANDWEGKLPGACHKMKEHDLSRIHIVAPIGQEGRASVAIKLVGLSEDISVVDLDGFVDALSSTLTKLFRNCALTRLYEYLDRYQESIERVNLYVKRLETNGLTIDTEYSIER